MGHSRLQASFCCTLDVYLLTSYYLLSSCDCRLIIDKHSVDNGVIIIGVITVIHMFIRGIHDTKIKAIN